MAEKHSHDLSIRSDRISHEEIKIFRDAQETRRYLSRSDREAANFGDAVFLDQIKGLKFVPGQRVRITDSDEKLIGVKAVVVKSYDRYILFKFKNRFGEIKKHTLLKADIMRGSSADAMDRGGRVKVELH